MKIQDIFKLNLNDRGGVKLFNKIMGRYNIPKADSKELINEVQNSSSGDGGIKEYYYKFKDEFSNNIHDVTIMDMSFLSFLHDLVRIDAIVCPIYTNDGGYHSIGNSELEGNFVILKKIKATPYFKIIDSNVNLIVGYQDDLTITYNSILPKIGNIENRLLKGADIFGGKEAIMEVLQMINNIIEEITKEEYESMITYKP